MVLPEKKLLTAIIARAIMDLTTTSDSQVSKNEREDAMDWISNWELIIDPDPFSFQWACEGIGVCPVLTRKRILAIPFDHYRNHKHDRGLGRSFNAAISKVIEIDRYA